MPRYWSAVFLPTLAASAVRPHDYLTWLLEALPAVAVFGALLATRRRLPLTPLSYALLLVLCLLVLAGAHYSFAHVPPFEWLRPYLRPGRNDFDKLAHLFQGLAPAVVFRELLVRGAVVRRDGWLNPIALGLTLALSAAYELLEWLTAQLLGDAARDFLALQGDPWDAQSDMTFALLGAATATTLLSRWHDRQLAATGSGRSGRR
ncbi:DUF2238 domain-containing protein [Candidatus Methylocalor cossyra]